MSLSSGVKTLARESSASTLHLTSKYPEVTGTNPNINLLYCAPPSWLSSTLAFFKILKYRHFLSLLHSMLSRICHYPTEIQYQSMHRLGDRETLHIRESVLQMWIQERCWKLLTALLHRRARLKKRRMVSGKTALLETKKCQVMEILAIRWFKRTSIWHRLVQIYATGSEVRRQACTKISAMNDNHWNSATTEKYRYNGWL